jgi:phosphatidylserine synthase
MSARDEHTDSRAPAVPREPAAPRAMLWFARDLPNVCSLAGLLSAVLGIYFAIVGVFPAAMIALLWAVVFDWTDGLIARRMKGRTEDQRAFGAQLDTLIDLVAFSVAPAVVLLSVGNFGPWFLPGAFLILATGVVRLSYFNVFGLVDGSTYRGLALDNNVLILALLFVFRGAVSASVFVPATYVALMALAALNVSSIRTPKLGGGWYYVLISYAACLSAVFGWRLLTG